MKRFTIHYELTVTLSEDEIYPDGTEGLGEITADKVYQLIEASGGMKKVIKDWNLESCGDLEVYLEQVLEANDQEDDKGITATSPEFKKVLDNAPPWDGSLPSHWR